MNNITMTKIEKTEIDLCVEAFEESDFLKTYYPNKEVFRDVFSKATEKDLVYVCKGNQGIIGFLWFSSDGVFSKFPYLNLIYVFQRHRGGGHAQRLMSFFHETSFAQAKNPRLKVFLTVKSDNSAALKLYRAFDYREIGEIDGLYRKRIKEKLMMKEIRM